MPDLMLQAAVGLDMTSGRRCYFQQAWNSRFKPAVDPRGTRETPFLGTVCRFYLSAVYDNKYHGRPATVLLPSILTFYFVGLRAATGQTHHQLYRKTKHPNVRFILFAILSTVCLVQHKAKVGV
jgi:hypothetical protein